jgi:cellulose/xylan binding protein with CBM9 domain
VKRRRGGCALLAAAIAGFVTSGCVEREGGRERAAAAFVSRTAPEPERSVHADLDGKVELVGVDAPARARPGDVVTVTWWWHCRAPVGPGWKLFTHVEGRGAVRVGADGIGPIRGGYPPSRWRAGDYIQDMQEIELPADAHGSVTFWVGVWKGNDRLGVRSGPSDGQNRVRALVLPLDAAGAQPAEPPLPRLDVPRADGPIAIDGRLDERAWARAASTGALVGIHGEPSPVPHTVAKLLWDGASLFVGWTCVDRRVESTYRRHDDELWNQDVVEVFLDPGGHGRGYYELQVSPASVVFDSYLPRYRANQNDWSSGMEATARVDGTLNAGEDDDRGWSAEMRIPLAGLQGGPHAPPVAGDEWRANLFRLDLAPGVRGARGAAWSPPIRPDFHRTQRFGTIRFSR